MIKLLLSALIILNSPSLFAGPRMQMVDRVRAISLANNGRSYDVLFFEHAAYYHVDADSPALGCLVRSMNGKASVSVSGDAATLVIDGCSVISNDGSVKE